MSLISYPFIRQYFWYYKKVNTEYFGKTLPILHIKYKYHIYYTNDDLKLFKKIGLSFSQDETCDYENVKYFIGTFSEDNHDEITSKLKSLYRIIYIDIDDKSIWKIQDDKVMNKIGKVLELPHIPEIKLTESVQPNQSLEKQIDNTLNDKSNELSIIEDYYSKPDEIKMIATKITDTTNIMNHSEVFDDDEFIIIEHNTADF